MKSMFVLLGLICFASTRASAAEVGAEPGERIQYCTEPFVVQGHYTYLFSLKLEGDPEVIRFCSPDEAVHCSGGGTPQRISDFPVFGEPRKCKVVIACCY